VNEQRRVDRPTGLLILMRFEPPTTRHLEVDLVLEKHGWAAEQPFDSPLQPTPADHCVETGVVPAEVFDALDYPHTRIEEAWLAIDHLRARNLGQCFRLVCKAVDLGQFSRRKEARRGQPAVSRIARERRRFEGGSAAALDGPLALHHPDS